MDLDEIRVIITGDASGLSSTISQVEGELNRLAGAESSAGAAGQRAARQTENGWQKAGKGLKEFGKSIDTIAKPIYVTSAAFAAGGVAAAKFAIDFEDNFAAVKKTVDGTPEQLDAIKQSIIDMTTVGINGHNAIPLTTAQLTELAAAGGQLGIQTENIAGFTETMAMLGTATNLVGEQGAATLARFMNVTNTSQDQVSNLGSAIVDLGNNFATTEAEIAQMALNMGATGSVVGISAQDILAYSTALSSLGVEAQAGGSAVSRIWMDIQSAVSSGGEDLEKFAKVSGKSSEEFAKQWKNDASGAFQDFLKGLGESKDQIGTLAELGFKNIRDIQALQRLAGPKGFELLTDAIKRSNEAWSNNVALQNEFDAKAETTASQIQVTKNNLVEAARGFGELFLPTIKNVTGGIAGFAKGLASLDNGTKQNIIGIGAAFIGLGAAVKGTTGIIKGIGGFVSAIGDIKAAFSAGGALASLAPTLAAIGPAAGIAAAGIVSVGAAVAIGKSIYDDWYNSQYRWSKGLSEGNARIKESRDELQRLSDIKQEVNDLRYVIKSPNSSKEDIENAKSRLEEIKSLLAEEYNLVINTDSQGLDEAAEKVEKVVDGAKERTKAEKELREAQQENKLYGLKDKFDSYAEDRQKIVDQIRGLEQRRDAYVKFDSDIIKSQTAVSKGEMTAAQAFEQAQEKYKEIFGTQYKEDGRFRDKSYEMRLDRLKNVVGSKVAAINDEIGKIGKDGEASTGLHKLLQDLDMSHDEFRSIATEMSNWKIEDILGFAKNGDAEGVANSLQKMGEYIRVAGLDMSGYAQAAALAMNGLTDFNGAVEKFANGDGADLSAIIRDYSTAMDAFGATAEQKQAGLQSFAQQLTDIAHNAGLFEGKQIEITADGKIEWKDIEPPEEEVTAPGKVEWSDTEPPKEETTADGTVEWGDTKPPEPAPIETLGTINWTETEPPQEAQEEVTTDGTVEWQDTDPPEPAPIEALGQINWAKSEPPEQEEFTAEGTVNYTGDFSNIGEVPPANGTANFGLGQSPTGVPDASGVANFTLGSYPTEIPPITATVNVVYQHEATGTQNFGGGLAMVNDQKGVSDPRELIVDKGRAFIPEGRDVILPLSKGAKVYTAAETKRILAGAGIPHYAGGKNNHYGYDITDEDLRREYEHLQNQLIARLRSQGYPKEMAEDTARAAWGSALEGLGGSSGGTSTGGKSSSSGGKKENSDAFKTAKEDWTHYTKTHAVTTEEELAKWVELSEQFKDNEKDIWDIEEEIYSLSVKLTKEMNDASKEYLEDHMFLNDWNEVGDSAIEAFNRVKERNLKEVEEQRMTWSEYASFMKSLGADVTDDMINQGIKRLEHEKKYNGLSEESYSEGIAEISAQLDEFYEQDLINYRQYIERKIEIGEEEFDAEREKLDKMLGVSNDYADERTYFNDWSDPDNDPIAAWERVRNREYGAIGKGRTAEEAKKNVADYGSKIFQGRLEQSYGWLDEQSKYFDLSNEDYIKGLQRMQTYTQKYLDEGIIGRVEYHKAMTELNHQIWDKQEEILNEGLEKQREEIDKIKQQFQDEEQALRDSWEVDDRRESIADLTEKVRLWQGAVTERGQEQLKQYQEQLKQAQREEQLYQLQVKNNEIIEDMETQYKLAEDNKKVLLRGIRSQMVDAQAAVNTLVDSVENNNSNLETLLGRIEKAIYSIETGNKTTNNYNDNRKQTTVNHNSNYGIGEIASGRWLSGQ